jgi:threonine/homoserine/homoserine lactone efflux protein
MLDRDLLAFAVVAGVITVIPGVDMALVARNVLAHRRPAGSLTSVGVCNGLGGRLAWERS